MEYSPMMVLMLWALTPSDCFPAESELTEQARVVEMPQPIMSVHPEAYFTFNHGRPFLAERDPLTGAIDSNIKTTPVTGDDYLYEEYEESGESIDRKDSASKIFSRNDITSPSKDSDLHKFLNLPVHYSSSGKFPLISSSYANTKVQGHGPLSNHKLYTSSTSTTTTVSPSYYTLKTKSTTAERFSTTTKATTTTAIAPSTTTTITPPTQRTTSTKTTTTSSTTTTKPPRATMASSTTTKPSRATMASSTTTTTTKPLLSNYDYEYEYDYDKNDGDHSSHDYEFLGSSSEVTSSYEKHSTTVNPVKLSTTQKTLSHSTKEPATFQNFPTEPSRTTTTKKPTEPAKQETPSSSILKPTMPSKPDKENHTSTKYQEDVYDLKPPKPVPSVELKPPQFHPTRPFSSVVPTKSQIYAPSGFVRYPESPLLFGDKKPFTVYSPENVTKSQPVINPTVSEDNKRHQDEKQNPSSHSTPQAVHLVQKKPLNEYSTETNVITTTIMSQNYNRTETVAEKINEIKKPLLQNIKEMQKETSNVGDRPLADKSSQINHHSSTEKPQDNHKIPYEVIKRPEPGTELDYKRPQSTSQQNNHEDLVQEIPVRPQEYRPQGSHEIEHNFQGISSSGFNRPPQDHRLQQTPQAHYKPTSPIQDSNLPQGIPQTQRPQDSIPDYTRLPANIKPDPNRPQISHLPQNKPLIHHTSEHNKPSNYQWLEFNRPPPSTFGLRITERPIVPERIQNVEHLRPPGKPLIPSFESIKPGNGPEVRPHQSLAGSEVRPTEGNQATESNQKPFIFAKPQSGKRPDFNAVQFGQPSKVENHFISVSPGNDNPSYSLQTSFSIGVPPPEQKQTPTAGSHGVGQVLFPDEESEKRPPPVPVWPHQRPPQSDPHLNVQPEKYPRPPWESHLKPPFIYHKKEQFPPIKRKPLPNILPQFRPNAKIGHAEPHVYLKPREPYDTLQPPPLPRPQFLRLEQDLEETKPLVHRRNGQSTGTRVTTLQMMQAAPSSKRAALRIDDTNEKNEPVFVVYPSNGNNAPAPPSGGGGAGDGVVVGTRGPQRPLPPDNLDIEDDIDSFPLDSNKNFQARVDTPVLKSKPPTSKPPIKNDFPYTLIKPIPEERIITPESVNTKEYTAFSPTVPSAEKDNDAEINIIPYLQDYMPFATKKPVPKEPWLFGPDVQHNPVAVISKQPNIDITPSSTHKNDNHREVSEGPQPQDFQAPFHASLTAPSQGWSVVQKKPNNEKNNEELTTNKEMNEAQTTEEPKFDIQNFKPQLFGGFKPIVPPLSDNEKKES